MKTVVAAVLVCVVGGVVRGDVVRFMSRVASPYGPIEYEIANIDFDSTQFARVQPAEGEWSEVLNGWTGIATGSRDSYRCAFRDWDVMCIGSKEVLQIVNVGKPDGFNWQHEEINGVDQVVFPSRQFSEAWNFAYAYYGYTSTSLKAVFTSLSSEPPSYDLNNDGSIDAGDAGLLFGDWTGDATPSVPEPNGAAVLLALGVMLAKFRPGPTNP